MSDRGRRVMIFVWHLMIAVLLWADVPRVHPEIEADPLAHAVMMVGAAWMVSRGLKVLP